jgi:hypothetical protein
VPLPLDDLRHTPDRFAYADRTVTFADDPGVPRLVELFTSKALYLASARAFYHEFMTDERYLEPTAKTAKAMEDGHRIFRYTVTAFTNVLGRSYPLRFEFTQEGRRWVQNGDWQHWGTGIVTAIGRAPKPEGLFNSALEQTVVDRRVREGTNGVDAIIYSWTNAFAPPLDSSASEGSIQRRQQQLDRKQSSHAPQP